MRDVIDAAADQALRRMRHAHQPHFAGEGQLVAALKEPFESLWRIAERLLQVRLPHVVRTTAISLQQRLEAGKRNCSQCGAWKREKFLGTNGEPREELFEADRLHPNADGYKILSDAIVPFLPKQ